MKQILCCRVKEGAIIGKRKTDHMADSQDVIYEAAAVAVGSKSGVSGFVQNRSEDSAEAAKRGLRSKARIRHPEYRPDEEIDLQDVEIAKLDPDTLRPL